MAAPTLTQPTMPGGAVLAGQLPVLHWIKADGTLVFANDTTPLPVQGMSGGTAVAVVGTRPIVATYSPTRFQNLGANTTLNVKASAGNVFAMTCYNANAAARYLLLHNSATVSSGAPLYAFLVPSASQIIVGTDFFTNEGANFDTGIAFGFSTTRDTYTAGSASDQTTVIHYK